MSGRVSEKLLGKNIVERLGSIKVLLIGVGGIGCEILKLLTKIQLGELHILDLDTIEVSNLNRQFLFRKEHRGKYKAFVAREQMAAICPAQRVFAYNDNIRDDKYDLNFFRQFQLVIMALDNVQTR